MIRLTKVSGLTGKTNTLTIPLTQSEFDVCYKAYRSGKLIQNAFPMLDAGLREFIKTGITPEEWEETFRETREEVAKAPPTNFYVNE